MAQGCCICRGVCRSTDPLDLLRLEGKAAPELRFVLVNPVFEAPTREMRVVLPEFVPFKQMLSNSVAGGSLVRPVPPLRDVRVPRRAGCMTTCTLSPLRTPANSMPHFDRELHPVVWA